MRTQKYKAMTIVELLITVIMTSIVILSLGSVLAAGHRNLNDSWQKVAFQRDASYVMYIFSLPIKEATGAAIEDFGSAITIDNRDGTQTRFFHVPESKQLQRQIEENDPHVIIDNVEDLQFSKDGNKIEIAFQLKEDDKEIDFISSIMMRNFGLE